MKCLKKILFIVLAFVMCALVLSACNKSEEANSDTAATDSRAADREARKREREAKRAERSSTKSDSDTEEETSNEKETTGEPEMVLVYCENQVDGYPTVMGAYTFRDVVAKETNGRIQVDVRINSEVGSEDDVVKMLQDDAEFEGNRVAFLRASLAPLVQSSGYEKLNVLQLPYLYNSKEHMRAVLNSDIGEVFLNELAENDTGLRGLSWFDSGARNFYNSKKSVKDASDLEGLKIRMQQNDMLLKMAELLGAEAVGLPYEEVPGALESGEIDCAENNWPSYVSQGHYKFAPYICIDEHLRIPEMIVMSDDIWNELSQSDQDILKRAAQLASETEWEEWAKQEKEYEEQAKAEGCEITEIKDKSSFQNAVKPIYEEFASEYMDTVKAIQNYKE